MRETNGFVGRVSDMGTARAPCTTCCIYVCPPRCDLPSIREKRTFVQLIAGAQVLILEQADHSTPFLQRIAVHTVGCGFAQVVPAAPHWQREGSSSTCPIDGSTHSLESDTEKNRELRRPSDKLQSIRCHRVRSLETARDCLNGEHGTRRRTVAHACGYRAARCLPTIANVYSDLACVDGRFPFRSRSGSTHCQLMAVLA